MSFKSSEPPDFVHEKHRIFDRACQIVERLLDNTRSRTISIKIKTLLKYAYASYIKNTLEIPKLRGLVPRIRVPSKYANQYTYNDLVEVLRQNFKISVEKRRHNRYIIVYK